MDVLEVGGHDTHSRRTPTVARVMLVAVLVMLATGIIVAAMRWWTEQSSLPTRLEIIAITSAGPFGIAGDDLPPDWPEGIVAGALMLRAEVTGDPRGTVRVTPAGDGGAYVAMGDRMPPSLTTTIPPRGVATVNVVVTPADCGAITATATPLSSPLVDQSGAGVPLADPALAALQASLGDLCAPGGGSPVLVAEAARIDAFWRDRALIVTTELESAADRALLQPLDGTALRGLRTQEANLIDGSADVSLRWLVSAGEMTPNTSLVGRVRAFTITDGRAYPWLLTMAIPRDLTVSTAPPTPLRNDGVDLAEVAPRPSS